jgi:hypothetical protein
MRAAVGALAALLVFLVLGAPINGRLVLVMLAGAAIGISFNPPGFTDTRRHPRDWDA